MTTEGQGQEAAYSTGMWCEHSPAGATSTCSDKNSQQPSQHLPWRLQSGFFEQKLLLDPGSTRV